MATLQDATFAVLSLDATLIALLTGGFFEKTGGQGRLGMTLGDFVKEADGVTVKPTGVLIWGNEVVDPRLLDSQDQFVSFYLYEDSGYSTIRTAARRTIALLNRTFVTSDNESIALFRWAGNLGEVNAEELQGMPMNIVRFAVKMIRT